MELVLCTHIPLKTDKKVYKFWKNYMRCAPNLDEESKKGKYRFAECTVELGFNDHGYNEFTAITN
jgi:hypothetical protein